MRQPSSALSALASMNQAWASSALSMSLVSTTSPCGSVTRYVAEGVFSRFQRLPTLPLSRAFLARGSGATELSLPAPFANRRGKATLGRNPTEVSLTGSFGWVLAANYPGGATISLRSTIRVDTGDDHPLGRSPYDGIASTTDASW
jgi:hypothetical protein